MRVVFLIVLFLHGLIHLLGFVKAFDIAPVDQLTQEISKSHGLIWLISTLLFGAAGVLYAIKLDSWWMPATAAVIISQYLIFTSWQDARFGTIANVIILVVAIAGYGAWRFNGKFERNVKIAIESSASQETSPITEADLQSLPVPVKRYLRYAGVVGKPGVKNFKIEGSGKIRQTETSPWMAFSSRQFNFLGTPTRLYFLNATMKYMPVAGYHYYTKDQAFMDIRLFSLIPVQRQSGHAMITAETVTFFNDMCVLAPATLIDDRIEWLQTDGNKVQAAFTNNEIGIEAWLHFNDRGELVNFVSDDRYAVQDDGTMKQMRWSTPLSDYKEYDGYRLASYGEAVYQYPEGNLTYGIFQVESVRYNLDEPGLSSLQ